MLLLLSACADPADTGKGDPADTDTDADTDSDTDADTDTDTDTRPDCTGVDCLSVCGVQVAVTDPVVAEGFSSFTLPDLMTRAARWHDGEAISVDYQSLVRRDADLADVDRVDLLPSPYQLEIAGAAAFASNGAGISVVDLSSGVPDPVAWWAPASGSGVMLAGASGDRLVLATPDGLSLVDVSDPGAPAELGCATWTTEQMWGVDVGDDFAAVAKMEGVAVYDLAGDAPVLLGEVPVTEEGAAALYGNRLLVWEDFRTVVLYELTAGAAPVELGRREDDTRVQATTWDPPVAGGLVLAGGLDDDVRWAVDLTDDALPVYSTDEVDPQYGCLVRYTGTDGTAWDVAPIWHPEARYAPGTTALDCPDGGDTSTAPSFGAREPGGTRLLYAGDGWFLRDVDTGDETALDAPYGTFAAWLDGGFAFAATDGSDWNIPLVSTVARTDEAGTTLDVVESPGPFVALAALDRTLWVLSEATGRDYGDPEPPATDAVLWTLDLAGPASDVPLPAGAAPIDLVSGGDRVWVFDAAGAVHVLDAALSVSTCALPDGLGDGARVASSLGAFFLDTAGRPAIVTADCTVTRLSDDPAPWTLATADDRWLYVAAEVAPADGFVATHQLLALDPGTLEVVGRVPVGRAPLAVGGDDRVAILANSVIVADRP